MYFPALCPPSTHRFPWESSPSHTELMHLEPGSTVRPPAAPAGNPSCGQACHPREPGSVPAGRGHWRGSFESPGVPMGCSHCQHPWLWCPYYESSQCPQGAGTSTRVQGWGCQRPIHLPCEGYTQERLCQVPAVTLPSLNSQGAAEPTAWSIHRQKCQGNPAQGDLQ